MPCDPRRSLITHPDAILFLRIWLERVFQQPLSISLIDKWTAQSTRRGLSKGACHPCLATEGEPNYIADSVVLDFDAVDFNFFSDLGSRLLHTKD